MDEFMLGMKLVKEGTPVTDEVQNALIDEAEAFLRSGLHDFKFWKDLSAESRASFMIANERIWRERCSMIGMASQSPLAATYVRSEEEGHDMVAGAAIDSFVKGMEAKEVSR